MAVGWTPSIPRGGTGGLKASAARIKASFGCGTPIVVLPGTPVPSGTKIAPAREAAARGNAPEFALPFSPQLSAQEAGQVLYGHNPPPASLSRACGTRGIRHAQKG